MKAASVRAIVSALTQAEARYLVVGGLAVVAHGYVRYTVNVDLVIALDPKNIQRATAALESLGYRPQVPVRLEEFADASIREKWRAEKGMIVLQLVSEEHRETPVDLFVSMPFDFEEQYTRAFYLSILADLKVPVLALDELLRMKRGVGRDKDRVDVEHLSKIHR